MGGMRGNGERVEKAGIKVAKRSDCRDKLMQEGKCKLSVPDLKLL